MTHPVFLLCDVGLPDAESHAPLRFNAVPLKDAWAAEPNQIPA